MSEKETVKTFTMNIYTTALSSLRGNEITIVIKTLIMLFKCFYMEKFLIFHKFRQVTCIKF